MNVRFDGDLPETLNKTSQPNARSNKQIVDETVIGITAKSGATRPAGKPDDCDDALGKMVKQVTQTEFEAKEVKGAARKAVNQQIGDTAIPVQHDNPETDPKAVDLN